MVARCAPIIASQHTIHAAYGGVVPELACRSHIENLQLVLAAALEQAHVTLDDIDVLAVTHGPGLVGALLVGVSLAKALAYGLGKPLVAIHHLEGTSVRFISNILPCLVLILRLLSRVVTLICTIVHNGDTTSCWGVPAMMLRRSVSTRSRKCFT